MILIIASIFILFFLIYLSLRFYIIFFNSQKTKTCKDCDSKDSERVSRNSNIRKIFFLKSYYKYWCRKCGNTFYIKKSNL